MAIAGIELFAIIGFLLAAYSTVANDAIQTLGTFLSSNSKRSWQILWLFAASIVVLVMAKGYFYGASDIAFDRLDKIPYPEGGIQWWHAVPPLALLILTRYGIPVSTTFLVLTIFSITGGAATEGLLGKMLIKSGLGYLVAFAAGGLIYLAISRAWEKWIAETKDKPLGPYWTVFQWSSTAFLWWQWLEQDLANIFVFLPRSSQQVAVIDPETGVQAIDALTNQPIFETAISFDPLLILFGTVSIVILLGITFWMRGGSIQKIVLSKTNTTDVRAATVVDLTYAIILLIFKEISNIPMSTTWVFLGLIAGREIAITYVANLRDKEEAFRDVAMDTGRALLGLAISVVLAVAIPWIATGDVPRF